MTQDNKWTVAELLARYELEPGLRDVFVEGTFDREVLSQYLQGRNTGHAFYEIDTVEISSDVLASRGLTSGNKQRIVALSEELAKVPTVAYVFCLADRDLDHWFVDVTNTARLRWSSFCSIEGHFVSAETIRDVLVTTSRAKIADFDAFVASLWDVLRSLYALRLADRELTLNFKWVAVRKYLARNGSAIIFDSARYAQAVLNVNAATKKGSEFGSAIGRWQQRLNCDIRFACRGHNYIELLAWAVSEFNGHREFATADSIRRLFVLLARSIPSLANEVQ